MAKYLYSKEIEAIQFTNTLENIEELKEFLNEKELDIQSNQTVENEFETVLYIDNFNAVVIGEWIISDTGEINTMSNEEFIKYCKPIN